MNPDNIDIKSLSKQFQFQKLANEIDSIDNIDDIKNIAKTAFKLYLKQQEVLKCIGPEGLI